MIHVQETRLQAVTGRLFYGTSMFAHLERLGFLQPKTSLIHAVWLTPDDISRIAASGASVQHNPTVNMKLGSGVMPMRELLDAGVNVSLGTDGCGLVETADMLRAVANTPYVQKLRGDRAGWIGAPEAWHAGTVAGARALGMERQLGRVEVGMKADLCGYSLDGIAMVPLNDPLRRLVYGESGAGLRLSVIDGCVVLHDGRLTQIDEPAIVSEALAIHEQLRAQIEQVESSVAPLVAPYGRIYERCLCQRMALMDRLMDAFACNDRIGFCYGPSGPQWVTDDLFRRASADADRRGIGLHIHALETIAQYEACRRLYPLGTVRHLRTLGALGPRTVIAHGVFLSDDDIAILAQEGASVATNPGSNIRLCDGIAPVAELVARGIRVGVGTDNSSVMDDEDLFSEARIAASLTVRRRWSSPPKPTGAQTIRMLTESGAAMAGFGGRAGRIDVGWCADLTAVSLDRTRGVYLDADMPLVDALVARARERCSANDGRRPYPLPQRNL